MTEKEIHELFAGDSLHLDIDREKKERSLSLLNQAIDQKQIVPFASPKEVLKNQLPFLDRKLLLLQNLCFVLLLLIFRSLRDAAGEPFLYIPMTVSAPVFSLFMTAGCRREETCRIAELTGSCFFNYRQICILRMTLYGILNLLFLSILALFLRTNLQKSAVEAGIYFLVPFLMTGCVQFAILLTKAGRSSHYGLTAGGLFMTAGWAGAASVPGIYEPAALTAWTAVLLVCAVSYGIEAAAVLKQIEKGDWLCTN